MVNVTIELGDVNDNTPTFTQPYYSTVLASHELGMNVLTVQAVDGDIGENGDVVYNIAKGFDKYYFSIDSRLEKINEYPAFNMDLALKVVLSLRVAQHRSNHYIRSVFTGYQTRFADHTNEYKCDTTPDAC